MPPPKNGFMMFPGGTGFVGQYEFYRSTTAFEAATFTFGFRLPLGQHQ